MVGGSLISLFDSRRAFRYMGIAAGVAAVVHFIIYYTYVRHHETIVVEQNQKSSAAAAVAGTETNNTDIELSARRKSTLETSGEAKLEPVGPTAATNTDNTVSVITTITATANGKVAE